MRFLRFGKFAFIPLLLLATMLTAQPPQPGRTATDTIGPVSHIIPPPPTFSVPEENYVYKAEWRIWDAGTVTLGVSRDGNLMRVNGSAESKGVVSLLYPVHDNFSAIYDPRTFCSVNVRKHTEEGFRKRDTLINFNYARKKSVLDETNLKNNDRKHEENDIPGCVTDVLSGFMYLRSMPLLVGSTYTFPINDGGKTVDVVARVEAKETVKVPAGTFQTIRVSPESGSAFKLKGKVWIWYTDDAKRIPVQMRGKMFWGTLEFKLKSVEVPKK